MIKWIKPSGSEIVTNDNKHTVEAAQNLGWKRVEERKKVEAPKKEAPKNQKGKK